MDDLIDASNLEILDLLKCIQLNLLLALHQKGILIEELQRADSKSKTISFLGIDAEFEDYGGLHGHLRKHAPVQLLSNDLVIVRKHIFSLESREDPIAYNKLNSDVHHKRYYLH